MIKINGQSLIERGIVNINKKIKNVYITVGYKSSKLSAHVINKGANAMIITLREKETLGVDKTLLAKINEPVLVLTCDNLFKLDYNFIVKEYERLKKSTMSNLNSCIPQKHGKATLYFQKKIKFLVIAEKKSQTFMPLESSN